MVGDGMVWYAGLRPVTSALSWRQLMAGTRLGAARGEVVAQTRSASRLSECSVQRVRLGVEAVRARRPAEPSESGSDGESEVGERWAVKEELEGSAVSNGLLCRTNVSHTNPTYPICSHEEGGGSAPRNALAASSEGMCTEPRATRSSNEHCPRRSPPIHPRYLSTHTKQATSRSGPGRASAGRRGARAGVPPPDTSHSRQLVVGSTTRHAAASSSSCRGSCWWSRFVCRRSAAAGHGSGRLLPLGLPPRRRLRRLLRWWLCLVKLLVILLLGRSSRRRLGA
jgi:hypothetical protein